MGVNGEERTQEQPRLLPGGGFEVVLWGYHRTEVDRCIGELESRLTELYAEQERTADLAAELERCRAENLEMQAKLSGVALVHRVVVKVEDILVAAERKAVEILAVADQKAQEIKTAAEGQGREIKAAAERRAREIRGAAEQELAAARDDATQIREAVNQQAARERRDCELTLREHRRHRQHEADEMLAAARIEAKQIVAEARVKAAQAGREQPPGKEKASPDGQRKRPPRRPPRMGEESA
jgi:hypothetical protein